MNNISKKQKVILIIIAIILTFIIGIFLIKRKDNSENIYENYIIEENEQKAEIKKGYIIVHITGEVKNSGIVEVELGSRISDVIEVAGGATENADLRKVNLAYKIEDGQKIYIPSVHDENEVKEEYITNDSGENVIVQEEKSKKLININTATQTELETLSGIGPSIALKIIRYKEENGKFKKIEDIKNVPGIGEAKYENIKEQICIK